jgi:PIN domain nuclease of toxin-antitoxin system
VKILLDTHILLWWLADDNRLTDFAIQLITNPENQIFISIASYWEMAIKINKGKLRVNLHSIIHQAQNSNFATLAIIEEHILALAKLQDHHKDPFDRVLAAQAMTAPMHLVTHDRNLEQYSELVLLV